VEDLLIHNISHTDSLISDESLPFAQRRSLVQLSGSMISCKYAFDDRIDSIRLLVINNYASQITSSLKTVDKNIDKLKKLASTTETISNYLNGISQILATLISQGIIKPATAARF